MKRLILLLLLVLACPAFAQNQTTVTGTLTDPNGIAYYPATVLACLSPSTLNPKVGGNSINLNQGSNYCIGPVSTSPSGFFQMALYTNASITPAATTWIFTVQAAGSAPPVGNGTLNFSSAGVTISGTSQDVSTNINSVGTAQFRSSTSFTGVTITCKKLENVRCIDPTNAGGWGGNNLGAWINSAFADIGGNYGTVYVATGSYTMTSSPTIGQSPCVDQLGQRLVIEAGANIRMTQKFIVACSGEIEGASPDSTYLFADGAFPTSTALIDIGDGTNVINARVQRVRLDCAGITGCIGIQGKGMNDTSYLRGNLIQNYKANAIKLTGTTATSGNFWIMQNMMAGATGASDGILATDIGEAHFERNSVVSNTAQATSAACIHFTGTLSPNSDVVVNQHCENHTDAVLIDGATGVFVVGIDAGGSPATTNGLHIAAGATGVASVIGIGVLPSDGAHFLVKNDITTNNLASNVGQQGQLTRYSWFGSSNVEEWVDTNGVHTLTPNGNTFFDKSATMRFRNAALTEDGRIAMDAFSAGQLGFGTTTAHPLSFYTNSSRKLNLASDGGFGFVEQALPAGTGTWDVCYGDATLHNLRCSMNNGVFQNFPQIIALTSQYTNSTTTFTNVAGGNTIQFPVLASTTYTATCHLYYQAAATGGLNIEFTGPASPTAVRYGMDLPTALTAVASGEADAFGSSIGAVSTNGAANLDAMVSFSLINGANAGTVNLLAKSSAAVQLQIQSGSFCQVQ